MLVGSAFNDGDNFISRHGSSTSSSTPRTRKVPWRAVRAPLVRSSPVCTPGSFREQRTSPGMAARASSDEATRAGPQPSSLRPPLSAKRSSAPYAMPAAHGTSPGHVSSPGTRTRSSAVARSFGSSNAKARLDASKDTSEAPRARARASSARARTRKFRPAPGSSRQLRIVR